MKRLLAGILLAFALSANDSLTAQCTTVYGACNGSVSGIACNTAPRVGLNWLVCAQPACAPSVNAFFLGGCAAPPVKIPGPVACANCSSNCLYGINPLVFTQPWPGTFCFQFNIPAERRLIGLTFCIQNACLFTTPCVCLSNTIQVRIQL